MTSSRPANATVSLSPKSGSPEEREEDKSWGLIPGDSVLLGYAGLTSLYWAYKLFIHRSPWDSLYGSLSGALLAALRGGVNLVQAYNLTRHGSAEGTLVSGALYTLAGAKVARGLATAAFLGPKYAHMDLAGGMLDIRAARATSPRHRPKEQLHEKGRGKEKEPQGQAQEPSYYSG